MAVLLIQIKDQEYVFSGSGIGLFVIRISFLRDPEEGFPDPGSRIRNPKHILFTGHWKIFVKKVL
jgi:hypothetical protein